MLAKPPNIKRATEYLAASDAAAISVTERGTIHTRQQDHRQHRSAMMDQRTGLLRQ
jgi:hypothetical protein